MYRVPTGQQAAKLKPAGPRLDSLVLLQHCSASDEDGTLGDLSEAMGFSDDPKAPANEPLQRKLDAWFTAAKDPALDRIHLAVLDLTKDQIRFAGRHARVPRSPGSMGKLMIMLAAYQLRLDLETLATKEKLTTLEQLAARIAVVYAYAQAPGAGALTTVHRRAGPSIKVVDQLVHIGERPVSLSPHVEVNLGRIFDKPVVAGGGAVTLRFRSDGLKFYQQYYIETYNKFDKKSGTYAFREWYQKALGTKEVVPNPKVAEVAFEDRLALMIGHSNNEAPLALVKDMGYGLVHSPLLAARLFSGRDGGLWLGHAYSIASRFQAPPIPAEDLPAGEKVNITATALSLATLMAAIVRKQIVDARSCDDMQRLLTKRLDAEGDVDLLAKDDPPGHATISPIAGALQDGAGVKTEKALSKLGIVDEQATGKLRWSDTAYMERQTPEGLKKFAVAILDVPAADYDKGKLRKAAQIVEVAIRGLDPPT